VLRPERPAGTFGGQNGAFRPCQAREKAALLEEKWAARVSLSTRTALVDRLVTALVDRLVGRRALMSIVRTASATLAAAAALGLGPGLTACGSATQPAAAWHPAASSPAAAQPDALAMLRQTGATPDPGTTSGEYDAYGELMATGSLPGGASASVYTSASQAAFSAEKSRAVGAYTGSDFTAGVVAIPAERTVIIVNSGSSGTWAKGAAPAQIAARVHGTVLLSTTPRAAVPPKTTQPKTTQPKTTQPTTQPSKAPAPAQPALTNGVAVVTQYYQDVSDKNYAAAWAIGGSNLAAQNGQTYDSWVAGYADTTASIGITSYGTWSNGAVWCYISAVQDSGTVNTYYGTYTVANGVIVSANIRQVG
jgi:hypothetical protein